MKVYDAARPCAKCGSPNVGTIYRPPLRMERRCARCSHVWFEKPLDAVEAPDTAPSSEEKVGPHGIGVFRMNPRD